MSDARPNPPRLIADLPRGWAFGFVLPFALVFVAALVTQWSTLALAMCAIGSLVIPAGAWAAWVVALRIRADRQRLATLEHDRAVDREAAERRYEETAAFVVELSA